MTARVTAGRAAVLCAALALIVGPASLAWATSEPEGLPHPASDEMPADGHAAPDAHASAGHEAGGDHPPEIDAKKLALQFLNFGVLVFILVKFGGGAINKALAARHQQLKTDLASAAALREAAEAKLVKQEARLASLEQEIAEMRRGIKAEAEAEKARLIAAAEERAKRIKAETAFLVEQQVRDAEARLRKESAEAALNMAEEILRRSIGAPDQQRLLETFVGDIERTSSPSAASSASPAPGRGTV